MHKIFWLSFLLSSFLLLAGCNQGSGQGNTPDQSFQERLDLTLVMDVAGFLEKLNPKAQPKDSLFSEMQEAIRKSQQDDDPAEPFLIMDRFLREAFDGEDGEEAMRKFLLVHFAPHAMPKKAPFTLWSLDDNMINDSSSSMNLLRSLALSRGYGEKLSDILRNRLYNAHQGPHWYFDQDQSLESLTENSSISEILAALRNTWEETQTATFRTLRNRLDALEVHSPSMQLFREKNQIHIQLPGKFNPTRIIRLFTNRSNLAFIETCNNNELIPVWRKIGKQYAERNPDLLKKQVSENQNQSVSNEDSLYFSLFYANLNLSTPKYWDSPLLGYVPLQDTAATRAAILDSRFQTILATHDLGLAWEAKPITHDSERLLGLIVLDLKSMPLSGKYIQEARQDFGQSRNDPVINLRFNLEGAKKWRAMTAANVGQYLAIIRDDKVISYPRVIETISGGNVVISGGFTIEEARDLAIELRGGSLTSPVKVLSIESISP